MSHRISCMHVQAQSHRIREYEQRVSDEFIQEVNFAEARISQVCEENAQASHEVEMRHKTTEFRQAIESTLAEAQQLLHEQAAKHADDTARVEAKNARMIDMMAYQNGLLQDELDELKRYQKQHDLREDGSKPKGVGDTREDSPELMTDDMKSARSQRSMLDPLSNRFQYAKEKLTSLVTYDGYEVEYTPSVIPTAESEALPADARDPQGSGSSRSPVKTSAQVPPLQFSQGPMPTDRKQGPGG